MRNKLLITVGAFGLASCVGIPGAPPAPETIRYATGPCLGPCPVYVVTVSSDGVGMYDGRSNVLVEGRKTFAISNDEFEQFKAALAPYRPTGNAEYRGANCTSQATDLPSVEVAWRDGKRQDILHVDFGCDMEANRAMIDTLATAPAYLPLDIYIGRR